MPLTNVDTSRLAARIRAGAVAACRDTMDDVAQDVARDIPVLTGAMRLTATRGESNGGLKQILRYPIDYASFTDTGTKEHTVRPRNKKALRFKIGGVTVFAKAVTIPAYKGTKWFQKNTSRQVMLAKLSSRVTLRLRRRS